MSHWNRPPIGEFPSLSVEGAIQHTLSLPGILEALSVRAPSHPLFAESLPFSLDDVTAGAENELQVVVKGARRDVDLPLTIERSNYYANIKRRILAGETSRRAFTELDHYLNSNEDGIWENSWVRFPLRVLSPLARETLQVDLLADKSNPTGGSRSDVERFVFHEYGEKHLRVPVSYLIKLALADVLGAPKRPPAAIEETGSRLLKHFSNDNTSPETFSFHVVPLRAATGMGRALAKETSKRFLITQLLTLYANDRFMLRVNGQEAMIYCAPHPPIRQKQLNDCISDAFYRELFMSPCLSGWDRGEEKHRYMALCHQVLSRSQLNAIGKLREAGIITSNLVVLPNTSNISLANNGTHVSLGSLRLSGALEDRSSGFTVAGEKLAGDLVIKIVEHFLPLFVGTYSAAPYRIDFDDFHSERLLAFLPHELDYNHLRMIWRRWKGKAAIKVFGHPLTPFGPKWVDRLIGSLFRLKGDFVPDFRLIDYFAALMSTERSPALDGTPGNGDRLKADLADLGVFDSKMALYMLYRLREFGVMRFSGFEGRHYSLFENLHEDMAYATDLQRLITAFAFKLMARGEVTHAHIPDVPFVESERRQIFFGTAVGIPTFYVRKDTGNRFLQRLVERCRRVRHSRRYPGYLRVYNHEYRKVLLHMLREAAADLVELFGMEGVLDDLKLRLDAPHEYSACGKLTRSILEELGVSSSMRVKGDEFNGAAEKTYCQPLRRRYLEESFAFLEEDVWRLDALTTDERGLYREELRGCLGERSVLDFVLSVKEDVLKDRIAPGDLSTLINIVLLTIHRDIAEAEAVLHGGSDTENHETPVYRAVHG